MFGHELVCGLLVLCLSRLLLLSERFGDELFLLLKLCQFLLVVFELLLFFRFEVLLLLEHGVFLGRCGFNVSLELLVFFLELLNLYVHL